MSNKIEISRETLQCWLDDMGAEKHETAPSLVRRLQELRALLATPSVDVSLADEGDTPVVERQPVDAILLENCEEVTVQDYGRGYFATDDCVAQLYTAPPELAELQAKIDRMAAENERLNKQLCVCPSCHGQGEIYSGHDSYQGQWQPPEPDMDKCGECDGDGVIGTPVDLAAALAEIKRLKGGQGEPIALTVREGAMPESNGKSNFTAILMRKNTPFMEGITGGICFERSEYPDRVRYEADCMRYLIGELSEEPDMLAYDSDKHSGYVRPTQPAPVSVAHNEAGEFTKWWCSVEILNKSKLQIAQEAWKARACLDKVKELNQ